MGAFSVTRQILLLELLYARDFLLFMSELNLFLYLLPHNISTVHGVGIHHPPPC